MPESRSEELLREVARLQDAGMLPTHVTREQLIDFAYGNASIENENITRKVAEEAVDALLQANPSSSGCTPTPPARRSLASLTQAE
jgi:hypothetical protein